MKVLIYEPFILWNFHFGTSLEIANNHLADNDEIHFLFCNASMKYCQINQGHENYCIQCVGDRYTGLNLLDKNNFKEHFLDIDKYVPNIKIPYFNNYDELKSYKLYGIKFGLSVLSSLITAFREPKINLDDLQFYINKLLKNSISIYFQTLDLLKKYYFDRVYIFNGRFFSQLPVVEACKKMNIDFYCHERAGTLNKYSLSKNMYIHNIKYVIESIEEQWNKELDLSNKIKLANEFYFNRRYKINDYSFTKEQIKNKLPDKFDKSKYNIVIYDSSIDEYEAVEDFENNKFKNIYKIISYIVENTDDKSIHFYLRVHPNLKGINNSQTEEIKNLKYNNLTVIDSDSDIDTYSLMENCNKIVTFGSTTEVEGNFMGKTVISIGISNYDNLNVAYKPKDYNEIIDLINNKDLLAMNIEGSIKFAYWIENYGYEFKNYKPENINSGLFKNNKLNFEYNDFNLFSNIVKTVINDLEKKIFDIKINDKVLFILVIKNNDISKIDKAISAILNQTYINNINLIVLDFIGIKNNNIMENKRYKYIYSNNKNIIKDLVNKSNEEFFFISNSNFEIFNFTIEFLVKKSINEQLDILIPNIYDYKNKNYFKSDNLSNCLIKKNSNNKITISNYPLIVYHNEKF